MELPNLQKLHLNCKYSYEERIVKLQRKRFYHITDWKERKRLKRKRKRLIQNLKIKSLFLN